MQFEPIFKNEKHNCVPKVDHGTSTLKKMHKLYNLLVITSSLGDDFHRVALQRFRGSAYSEIFNEVRELGLESASLDVMRDNINSSDVLCFCPNSTINQELEPWINRKVHQGDLSLIFLRGIENFSAPYQLGYVNNSYVDWANANSFALDVLHVKQLNSIHLNRFLQKYNAETKLFYENSEKLISKDHTGKDVISPVDSHLFSTFHKINLDGSYICGETNSKVVDYEKSWTTLAYSTGDTDQVRSSVLIHNQYKVMFPHFYGFSEADTEYSKDLLKALIQYLLLEHGSRQKSRTTLFFSRLFNASRNNIYSDISISAHDYYN